MGLKFGSIVERKNLRTGGYTPAYILLSSKHPKVFLLNNSGCVIAMELSHFESELSMRRFRFQKDMNADE